MSSSRLARRRFLYLDFDGATIWDFFGGPPGNVNLSPLSTFLAGWGLTANDENAVIDAIIASVIAVYDDIRTSGNNGDRDASGVDGEFDIEIQNSRDNPDMFSET